MATLALQSPAGQCWHWPDRIKFLFVCYRARPLNHEYGFGRVDRRGGAAEPVGGRQRPETAKIGRRRPYVSGRFHPARRMRGTQSRSIEKPRGQGLLGPGHPPGSTIPGFDDPRVRHTEMSFGNAAGTTRILQIVSECLPDGIAGAGSGRFVDDHGWASGFVQGGVVFRALAVGSPVVGWLVLVP